MDDDLTAAVVAEQTMTTRHVPHDLMREILIRLPVKSLLRFKCVCKTWRSTISDDPSFGREQLRHNQHKDDPCLLIAPQLEAYRKVDNGVIATPGLYRWRESRRAATLVHPMDSLRSELAHPLAHCDGLILVGTESMVRVLNPATQSVFKLPENLCYSCEAFGLGRDPGTGAYKVAWIIYRTEEDPLEIMEVFTIGVDQHLHETKSQPPYDVMVQRTATFFKGSLLWHIHKYPDMPGYNYLRFRLEDESFSIIPSPPYRRPLVDQYHASTSELRGELCVASPYNHRAFDIWMCADLDGMGANLPQWEKRYTIRRDRPQSSLRPVAVLGNGVLMCESSRNRLCRCDLQTEKRVMIKDSFDMNDMYYYNLREGKYGKPLYRRRRGSYFDVIPYVPSLVSI